MVRGTFLADTPSEVVPSEPSSARERNSVYSHRPAPPVSYTFPVLRRPTGGSEVTLERIGR